LLIGRGGAAGLRLEDNSVSSEHAVLVSRGSSWSVRDLGSSNGTFVAGERLSPGVFRELRLGDELRLGLSARTLQLVDDAAPQPFARRMRDGVEVAATANVLALPTAAQPTLQVMPMGAGWLCSDESGDQPIADGDVIRAHGDEWRVFLPGAEEETLRPENAVRVQQLDLTFLVSADEETVLIEMRTPHAATRLESRVHNYLLLHLARQRLKDTSLSLAERGWVERGALARALLMDPEHLNVQLFRIRRSFAEAGVVDAGNLLECRRRPGQIRIGVGSLRIEALSARPSAFVANAG
jgi:pSer/pThr/pTyr-binding forkhead associated (FHA) protein